MSSPVSIGDAIALLTQIYHIYDAYRSTPEKLRQALRKFNDTQHEVESLNQVLASSRRAEYKSYPHTAELVADLSEARKYLERFEPLIDESGGVRMISRAKITMKAKWDWEQVKNHVAKMDIHRDNMKDFKQTVLLQAAQDNIELQIMSMMQVHQGFDRHSNAPQPLHLNDNASTISSDQMSVLTKASRSLAIARKLKPVPEGRSVPALSPDIERSMSRHASAYSTNVSSDLKKAIADYVEQKGLYLLGSGQDMRLSDLQHVAELPSRWVHQQRQREQEAQQTRPARRPGLRHSIDEDRHSTHSVYDIHEDEEMEITGGLNSSPSIRRPSTQRHSSTALSPRQLNLSARSLASRSQRLEDLDLFALNLGESMDGAKLEAQSIGSISTAEPLGDPALLLDTSSIADTRMSDAPDESGDELVLIHDPVMLYTPWTGQRPIVCHLRLIKSAGSLCVRSTTTDSLSLGSPVPASNRHSASPSTILGMNYPVSMGGVEAPLVFNHAVLGGMGSFPRILHPRVEGEASDSNQNPYNIEFYSHQFISVDGRQDLPKAVRGIAYQFRRKEDRDLVRSMIFGRHLLASAGISTIQFDKNSAAKPCGTQAMTLWSSLEDAHSNPTITIQCSTKGRSEPDCAVEFTVFKATRRNIDKVIEGNGKELEIEIYPTPVLDDIESPFAATSALSSSASRLSYTSEASQTGNSQRQRPSSILGFSRRSSLSSRSISQSTEPFHAYIKFSEGSPDLLASKKKFLDVLRIRLRI